VSQKKTIQDSMPNPGTFVNCLTLLEGVTAIRLCVKTILLTQDLLTMQKVKTKSVQLTGYC
jgi:hypothetical protein